MHRQGGERHRLDPAWRERLERQQVLARLGRMFGRAEDPLQALQDHVQAVSEIGDAENISKSYVSRILRLALLAPDIIETILAGRPHGVLMLDQFEQPPPASWEDQRELFGFSD